MQRFPSNPTFTFSELLSIPYPSYEFDVVKVLDSVVELYRNFFPNVDEHPLTVINNRPRTNYPHTIYESDTIALVVSPGTYWSQFIYQFAHEFCHYMNFGTVIQPMRWFEETLCELASQFFLIKSAEKWLTDPPYPNWTSYSTALANYQRTLMEDIIVFDLSTLWNPESTIMKNLIANEYMRPYNRYIAVILLPLFLNKPNLWNIVPVLPKLTQRNSFQEYLDQISELSQQNLSDLALALRQTT